MDIKHGQYAVLRNGTVTGALDYIRSFTTKWFWQGMGAIAKQRWTREGHWSMLVQPHPLDIIETFDTKEEAVAYSILYLDRLDKPNRRGHINKEPNPVWVTEDDKSWGPWRTDIDEWNTAVHDVQHECIGGIHRTRLRRRKPKTYWLYGNCLEELNVMDQEPSSTWPICFEVEEKK